ncbi:MAG: T9SS type A sorting domain-containing protein, partial [Bacteroidales bacterium]|nr:T9SS type A sorting domain-containing protein [Bacteroidales bacterium]
GTTWIEQTVGNRDLRDLYFLDNETGYMVGRNGTLLAYDGLVWAIVASGTGKDLNGIFLFNDSKGYLVGNDGIVISYQGDGFNSPYLKNFTVGADLLQYRLSKLAFGKSHYFRMRAVHGLSTSEWSGASAFTVISHPVLKTPANNASSTQLDLFLTWEKITGIVKYNIQLATNAEFTDPLLFETSVEEYEINNLIFGTTYFWRVNARHADGTSGWSPAFNFTTLDCVTLKAPANNATEITRLPRYEWTEILGVEKYMVEVDKSPDFTNPEVKFAESNMYQQLYLLDKEVTYYWRVRAIQGLDTTNWCSAWSFTTKGETSIGEQYGNEFKIYPNPATDQFQVNFEAGTSSNATLEVYNMIGNKVYQKTLNARPGQNSEVIDISGIKAGMYFIKLQMNDKA